MSDLLRDVAAQALAGRTLDGVPGATEYDDADAVLAALRLPALFAAEQAKAWDEGVRHAENCPGGLSCDPRTANPYRAQPTPAEAVK